jgi:hypothetical protein
MSDSRSVRVGVSVGHLVEDGARVHDAGTILCASPQRAAPTHRPTRQLEDT